MHFFPVQFGRFNTWQNFFAWAPPVAPATNIRYGILRVTELGTYYFALCSDKSWWFEDDSWNWTNMARVQVTSQFGNLWGVLVVKVKVMGIVFDISNVVEWSWSWSWLDKMMAMQKLQMSSVQTLSSAICAKMRTVVPDTWRLAASWSIATKSVHSEEL